MLNEMIDIFLGMLNYAITEVCGMQLTEFSQYNWWVGVICTVVTAIVLIGSFALLVVVVSETFKTIRGANK